MPRVLITYRSKAAEKLDDVRALGASKHPLHGKACKRCKHIPVVTADLTDAECDALKSDPAVLAVEPDGIVETCADTIPPGIAKVRAPELHALNIFGAGVKLAIIDTGIDTDHPDLAAIYQGGHNFLVPANPPEDDNSHGTHCAGIAAAVINGSGILGMAPSVDLYALKVLNATGQGQWSHIIEAYDWCIANGMQVTSNSYGSSVDPGIAVETAFNAAYDAGILMIVSAGNRGPADNSVGYPAKFARAVAVSAVDANDVIANFSSRGPEVALCAPGVLINSTVLNGGYGNKSGTSMSCPHVAGACALALSAGLTVADVRTRIPISCVDLGAPGRDNLYGWGLLDAVRLQFDATTIAAEPKARDAASVIWV